MHSFTSLIVVLYEVKCFKVWDRRHVITHYQHLNLAIVTLFMKARKTMHLANTMCQMWGFKAWDKSQLNSIPALVGYLLSTPRPGG